MGGKAKYILPVLGLAAAGTGIGALAAPALFGAGAAGAGAGAGLAGATAGMTAGTGAAGAGLAGATAGALGAAAPIAAGASHVAPILGGVSTGLNLVNQGAAPFFQPQQGYPNERPNGSMANLKSLTPNYYG